MWPFNDNDNDNDDDRPRKPDLHNEYKTYERTRYEATIEYRNGDTETFECYGVYDRGEAYIRFNIKPYARTYRGDGRIGWFRKKIHYETLAREPVVEEIATDTFRLTWHVDYEWRYPYSTVIRRRAAEEWVPKASDVKLTIEEGTG